MYKYVTLLYIKINYLITLALTAYDIYILQLHSPVALVESHYHFDFSYLGLRLTYEKKLDCHLLRLSWYPLQ